MLLAACCRLPVNPSDLLLRANNFERNVPRPHAQEELQQYAASLASVSDQVADPPRAPAFCHPVRRGPLACSVLNTDRMRVCARPRPPAGHRRGRASESASQSRQSAERLCAAAERLVGRRQHDRADSRRGHRAGARLVCRISVRRPNGVASTHTAVVVVLSPHATGRSQSTT